MKKYLLSIAVLVLFISQSCAQTKDKSTKVRFETSYGNIAVKLYPETVKHRENFLKLVNEGFYSGVLFHRVIADFMIQAGDPESKKATSESSLGSGDVGYTVPAEFIYPKYYHKRGALAAARQGDQMNPQKASSGCQFYIVQGKVFTDQDLNAMEQNNYKKLEAKLFQEVAKTKEKEITKYQTERNQAKLDVLQKAILAQVHLKMTKSPTYKFTAKQRADYKTLGGTPHLDGEYTVFGEVVEGLDIVANISKTKTGRADRPAEDIKVIKAEVIN